METANRKDGTLQEGWGEGSRWVRFDKRSSPTNTALFCPPLLPVRESRRTKQKHKQ